MIHIAIPLSGITSRNAWLANHRAAENKPPSSAVTNTERTQEVSLHRQPHSWLSPDGRTIPLSPNEYWVPRATARAEKQSLGRKALLETLSHKLLRHNERKTDAPIRMSALKVGCLYFQKAFQSFRSLQDSEPE